MSIGSVEPPFEFFDDGAGKALEAGYIYIGTANLDPVNNPISIYWDAALTIPITQPVRTVAGVPSNGGQPATIYVGSDYSIEVQNKNQAMVYEAPTATGRVSAVIVTYTRSGTGAVSRTLQSRLEDAVFIKDFGAVGDGTTDDTAAIQAALDYVTTNDAELIFTDGNYSITSGLVSDAASSRRVKIIGKGLVKIKWNGGANKILLDLRRWVNTCELGNILFENTIQAAGVTCVRMTCWTGTGTTLSGTVDMAWLHDLVIGQSGDLGFEYGLRCGDQTTYGSGEFFTFNCFDRIFYRHCTYGMYIDATAFDVNHILMFNANGGGSAADGSDANSTTHLKAITNVDKLLIEGFNSNRCSSYAIELAGGSVKVDTAWFEHSAGAYKMTASGSSRPVVIDNAKFTNTVFDGSGNSVDINIFGTVTVRDCEFDTGDLLIRAEQPLVTSNNEFTNDATITRNDNRFKRTYNPRPLGQAAPHWERVKLLFSDFDSAATTVVFDIPVADEPTSTVIHDVFLFAFTGFRGGSVTAATLDFGLDSDATGFFTGANVYNTGAFRLEDPSDKGSLLFNSTNNYPKPYLMEGSQTLRATLQLTGGNGSDLTAGECYVYILTSALFAAESYYPELFN